MTNYEFAERIPEGFGQKVTLCYQCRKCTAGCPLAFAMDVPPDRIIRLVVLGLEEKVLKSRALWICSSCQTCTTRCPNGIDIAGIIDELKHLAAELEAVHPECGDLYAFHRFFLDDAVSRGRIYEPAVIGKYSLKFIKKKLRDGTLREDFRKGFFLVKHGRMQLLPPKKRPLSL
ncbi:4Fe-4S dicluster domain-containing protein [Thermodesulforhabdus norvegica]|uniref:Heterodisulfide reductase subunit C n=1 Tax=Thermodesulforhabdus norvegica TaxID=39841 RepID=A0A1I4SIU7_9BACT|nr:4Fe-4S dicluster domain-containing protein [Thermodesulforhabdus norvegica]SFM64377.1 heterodisulfide reductase subunit C [Thermodesulforhabdus norvegica]